MNEQDSQLERNIQKKTPKSMRLTTINGHLYRSCLLRYSSRASALVSASSASHAAASASTSLANSSRDAGRCATASLAYSLVSSSRRLRPISLVDEHSKRVFTRVFTTVLSSYLFAGEEPISALLSPLISRAKSRYRLFLRPAKRYYLPRELVSTVDILLLAVPTRLLLDGRTSLRWAAPQPTLFSVAKRSALVTHALFSVHEYMCLRRTSCDIRTRVFRWRPPCTSPHLNQPRRHRTAARLRSRRGRQQRAMRGCARARHNKLAGSSPLPSMWEMRWNASEHCGLTTLT